jgi:hypothetical protein
MAQACNSSILKPRPRSSASARARSSSGAEQTPGPLSRGSEVNLFGTGLTNWNGSPPPGNDLRSALLILTRSAGRSHPRRGCRRSESVRSGWAVTRHSATERNWLRLLSRSPTRHVSLCLAVAARSLAKRPPLSRIELAGSVVPNLSRLPLSKINLSSPQHRHLPRVWRAAIQPGALLPAPTLQRQHQRPR